MDHFTLGHKWIRSRRCMLPILSSSSFLYILVALLPHSAASALLPHSTIGLLLRHPPSITLMRSRVTAITSAVTNSSYSVTLEALSRINYPKNHIKVIKCKIKNYVVFHMFPNNF